jgi:hypothetical protein
MAKRPVGSILVERFSIKKVIFGILILAMIFFFLNGGPARIIVGILNSRPDTDVTLSPEYDFKAFAGTVWKTKVKVALADTKWRGRHDLTLLAPKFFDPTHPEYTPSRTDKIIAVLPVGTRVQIERLMQDNGNWGGVWVIGSLEDGKVVIVEAHLLAKNRFIWQGWSDSKEWGVDPDMLEKAE